MTTPWVSDILDEIPVGNPVGKHIKDILAKFDCLLEQDDIVYQFVRALRQYVMERDWNVNEHFILNINRYCRKLEVFEYRSVNFLTTFASHLKIRSNAVNHFVKREKGRIDNPSNGPCLTAVGKALQKMKGMKNVSEDMYSHILSFLPPNPIHQIFSKGTKIVDTWLIAGKRRTQYEFHFNCPMVYTPVFLPRITNIHSRMTPYFPSLSPTFSMMSFRVACLKWGVDKTMMDEIEKRISDTNYPLVL